MEVCLTDMVAYAYECVAGEALSRIAGRQVAVSEAMEGVCRSLSIDLATPLDSGIDNGARELDTFEKEMKDNRTRLAAELKKLEGTTKKAGGKGGDQSVLIQAMKDFNAKREEIDRFKSDQLHTVFLIERRRFGEILSATTKVVGSQMEYARVVLAMEADAPGHTQLLSTLESLSEEQISALSVASQKPYTSLNTSEAANVTLTGSTNAALSRAGGPPPTAAYGSPRPMHSGPGAGQSPGGPPPPGPPGGAPPPPNFAPSPPSFEPPPPMSPGGTPKMGPPKFSAPPPMPGGGPPGGGPPSSPRPNLPPPMPSGGPPGSNGTLRSGSKAPPPVPGKMPPPMPGKAPGGPPPPPMGAPPPPMGGGPPPPPMGGGGPPPPPPGGAPPPPKPSKTSASTSSGKKKAATSSGGGGGDERNALLGSINNFKGGLKKTVTNDRSAPVLKEDKKPGMGRGGPPMF